MERLLGCWVEIKFPMGGCVPSAVVKVIVKKVKGRSQRVRGVVRISSLPRINISLTTTRRNLVIEKERGAEEEVETIIP
jgi:hypothetical protein